MTNRHGPENAEHELRKAYNCLVETGTTYSQNLNIPGVKPEDLVSMYKHAHRAFRDGNRLLAERWARSAKHLARAFWHEAKIAYLERHKDDVPFLEGATANEYNLHEHSDTGEDLLNSVAQHVPPGLEKMPPEMMHYLSRGRRHLEVIKDKKAYSHELLRAERIKAAHEYGRLLECMALAYETESQGRSGEKAA